MVFSFTRQQSRKQYVYDACWYSLLIPQLYVIGCYYIRGATSPRFRETESCMSRIRGKGSEGEEIERLWFKMYSNIIFHTIYPVVPREPIVTKFGTQIIDTDLVISAKFGGNRFINYSFTAV